MFLRSHAKRLRELREIVMDDYDVRRRHRQTQSRLARKLLDEAAIKLGVRSSSSQKNSVKKDSFKDTFERTLLDGGGITMGEDSSEQVDFEPVKLTDIIVRTNGGWKDTVGTLEAHVYEFQFSTSSADFQIKFLHKNVKHGFIQVNKDTMMPFLHFHLYEDIMVGTEKTKDIQFHGVKSVDMDKTEEENQNSDTGTIINVFQEFVFRVNDIWDNLAPIFIFPIHPPEARYTFCGHISEKRLDELALTLHCLIQLSEIPFLVVTLTEIEIVHLVVGHNLIDMTVVFKDFECSVLEIKAIPITHLNEIRLLVGVEDVKYYLSTQSPDWVVLLEQIRKKPERFIEAGGWEILNPMAGFESTSDPPDYGTSTKECIPGSIEID